MGRNSGHSTPSGRTFGMRPRVKRRWSRPLTTNRTPRSSMLKAAPFGTARSPQAQLRDEPGRQTMRSTRMADEQEDRLRQHAKMLQGLARMWSAQHEMNQRRDVLNARLTLAIER